MCSRQCKSPLVLLRFSSGTKKPAALIDQFSNFQSSEIDDSLSIQIDHAIANFCSTKTKDAVASSEPKHSSTGCFSLLCMRAFTNSAVETKQQLMFEAEAPP